MKRSGPALALSLVAVLLLPAAPLDALTFRRADANLDGSVNIADAVTIFSYLFSGGALPCVVAGDANDDEAVDIADAIAVLDSLFSATSPIPPPFPHCGPDPTPGALPCAVPGPCAEAPELVSASATAVRPGDLLELSGFNFDPDPLGNIVAFVGAGGDEIRGQVESVSVAGGAPPLAATLDVRVPSGVRTGTVELRLPGTPFPLEAGAIAVTAAPVLLGAAVGDDGTIVAVLRDALGNISPDTIQLFGINLGSAVANVTIFDGIQTHGALSVVPGLPPTAQYGVPDGLEAITVELPPGLLPLGCTTSRLVFTAFGAGSPGPS